MSQIANQLSTPAIRIDYESLRRSMGDVATRLISLEQVVVAQSQDIALLGQHVQAILTRLGEVELLTRKFRPAPNTVPVEQARSVEQAQRPQTPEPQPIRYRDGDNSPDEEMIARHSPRKPETIEDVLARMR